MINPANAGDHAQVHFLNRCQAGIRITNVIDRQSR
jgi:hypothetical protein